MRAFKEALYHYAHDKRNILFYTKEEHASQKSSNHRMQTTNLSMSPQQTTNASRVFSRSDARLWAKEIEPVAQIALVRLHLLISTSN